MSSLRILIADDHDLMRRGLRQILLTHSGWEICAEAQTGTEAVAKAQQFKPEVAILDISMPLLDGLSAARQILQESPTTEILILSMHYSDQLISEMIEAGVRGFVVKSDSDRDLVFAVEALANHKPFFTAHATEVMLSRVGASTSSLVEETEAPTDRLTSREREIVRLIAEGSSSAEAAAVLKVTAKIIDTHRANIMRKLDLHTIPDLVRYALRNKIIEP